MNKKWIFWLVPIVCWMLGSIPLVIYFDRLHAPVGSGANILRVFFYGLLCSGGIVITLFLLVQRRCPQGISAVKTWLNYGKLRIVKWMIYLLFFLNVIAILGTIPLAVNQFFALDTPVTFDVVVTEKKWVKRYSRRRHDCYAVVKIRDASGTESDIGSLGVFHQVQEKDTLIVTIQKGSLGIYFYVAIYLKLNHEKQLIYKSNQIM